MISFHFLGPFSYSLISHTRGFSLLCLLTLIKHSNQICKISFLFSDDNKCFLLGDMRNKQRVQIKIHQATLSCQIYNYFSYTSVPVYSIFVFFVRDKMAEVLELAERREELLRVFYLTYRSNELRPPGNDHPVDNLLIDLSGDFNELIHLDFL